MSSSPFETPPEIVDCVVIGAGVVGLAVARALALAGREVIVVEAAEGIGTETSSRNSEVIHAGIYYPKGSLMARTCVAGRRLLYAYCAEHGVPHRNCGKLIAATNDAEDDEACRDQGPRRSQWRGGHAAVERRRGKGAGAQSALHRGPAVAATGHHRQPSYMLALQGDAEAGGAMSAFHSPVKHGRVVEGGIELEVGGTEPMMLRCRLLINSAGLHAPALAKKIAGMPSDRMPTAYYAKGNYFTLAGRSPFSRLIYPVPVPGGLGVHITVDMGGQAKFGPDVEWIGGIDYTVDPHRADKFYAAVRRYWPELKDGALQPGYAGIRPKIVPPGAPAQDFTVQGPAEHGVPGLINLFGIESPGLTASLALAEQVRDIASA